MLLKADGKLEISKGSSMQGKVRLEQRMGGHDTINKIHK
jgi:hypothetical protein